VQLREAKSIPVILGDVEEIRAQRGPFFISPGKGVFVCNFGRFSPLEAQFNRIRSRAKEDRLDSLDGHTPLDLDSPFRVYYNYYDRLSVIDAHVRFESDFIANLTYRDILNNDPWKITF
jgi:hypothetical protein